MNLPNYCSCEHPAPERCMHDALLGFKVEKGELRSCKLTVKRQRRGRGPVLRVDDVG